MRAFLRTRCRRQNFWHPHPGEEVSGGSSHHLEGPPRFTLSLASVRKSAPPSRLPERLAGLDSFNGAITILVGENSGRVGERKGGRKIPIGASRWDESCVSEFPV